MNWYNFKVSLKLNCVNQLPAPPSPSPDPEQTVRRSSSSLQAGSTRLAEEPRWPRRPRSRGPPSRPGRPSPVQHLDLQIFPRSKIMARRWLRSPRIRNTFMVQPPASTRAANSGKLSGAPGGCHIPGRSPWVPRAPARASEPRASCPGAAAPPAHSRPGGDVARPAAARGQPGSAAARDPASRPIPAPRGPGRGRCPPLPTAAHRPGRWGRRGQARRAPRPALRPQKGPRGGQASASLLRTRCPPASDPGKASGPLSASAPHLRIGSQT